MSLSPPTSSARSNYPPPRYQGAGSNISLRAHVTLRNGIWATSWLYLASILALIAILQVISEHWWLGTALTYLPRSPYIVPGLLLLPFALWKDRRSVPVLLCGCAFVVGPVMNLHGNPLRAIWTLPHEKDELRIVSCNVQGFRPKFEDIVAEISRIQPQVAMFQEAYLDHSLMHTYFAHWHVIREGNHVVASLYPIKLLAVGKTTAFDRTTALRVEVQTPQGPIHVYSIHQTSQRESLVQLRPWSFITGEGVNEVQSETDLRLLEAKETRSFVDQDDPAIPAIYAGDFNITRDSSLYTSTWNDLANTFDNGGFGYAYTSLCYTKRIWPEGCPWVKVDHILASPHWTSLECRAGTSNGSDHRLITARLRLNSR
ncbi:MAG: endonuclease/exonuclease/phosphatase family protein [Planctomycetales bacterium]